ncbi:hypothetical protein [Xanthomonas sp. 60]
MAFAPAVKTWLLVVPAVALLGLAGLRVGERLAQGAGPSETFAASGAQGDAPMALGPLAMASSNGPGSRREPGRMLPSGLPLDLRADLEGDTDLHALAQRLRVQADAGNVEARWVLSRVYDYCSPYANDAGGYQRDSAALATLGSGGASAMVAARSRVADRCAGFVPSDNLGHALVFTQRRQAALGGNLAAEASLMADGQPLEEGDDYRRSLVQRVRASRDPEAFMALAPAMGLRAAGDQALVGLVAGEALSELAWRVAACDLGMACGPGSVLMNSYCANGGICSQDAGQGFTDFVYDAAVSRQGAEKMTEWVEQLTGKRTDR